MAILLIGIFAYARVLGTESARGGGSMSAAIDRNGPVTRPAVVAAAAAARRRRSRCGDRLLLAYTWLMIAWLALPIAVVILFSFNNPHGRYNFTWTGFTFKWWGPQLFDYPELTTAMEHSLLVALVATGLDGPRHADRAGPRQVPVPRPGPTTWCSSPHRRARDRAGRRRC